MVKIDLEKLICSLAKRKYFSEEKLQGALKEQGLEYKDGEIVESQKPKFKVGDWITTTDDEGNIAIEKIIEFWGDKVRLIDTDGVFVMEPKYELKNYHLWTIQDAKDGDILACGDKVTDWPFIFHNLTEKLNPRSYCGVNTLCDFQENDENGGSWCKLDEVRPATKEQRDFLFSKMEEAGYEWDAKKKKLKKIRKPLYEAGNIIIYKGYYYGIKEVVKDEERDFYYNLVAIDGGKVNSIGPAGEKDITLLWKHANIQQKDFTPKATAANRQLYNRAILKLLSNYVEKYPDIRFGQMLCNLDVNPHFDEESKETYWNLSKTINKRK